MNEITLMDIFNALFFVYGTLIILLYIATAILAVVELNKYLSRTHRFDFNALLSFDSLPGISVVAPAFNEERTIIQNISGLLSLKYPDFEIIVVNDGSRDKTLEKVIEHFKLAKTQIHYDMKIPTEEVRGIYKSHIKAFSHLTVIDKVNGGKSDALNAGLNRAKNELFLALDVDCIVEPDALLRMVRPFLDDSKSECIATGSVIRVANSCEIENGHIREIRYPRNLWAKFQVLEYFRAFTLGRMAWKSINGLLIISGAFGMFNTRRAIAVGGYDVKTVGEDLEIVLRMRRYMHDVEKKKYFVSFIPDPICWTEVPESFRVLSRQRRRWIRGAVETIRKHKTVFLNPRYGIVGLVSFPNLVLFEWLAPVIQFIGFGYVLFMAIFGLINIQTFLMLLLFVISFALMYSFFGVFYESYTYNKYDGTGYLFKAFIVAVFETLLYQPLNMYFAILGNYDAFLRTKAKNKWGDMTRKGFEKEQRA